VNLLSTNFSTRYYRSTNARAPSIWIRDQFLAAVADASDVLANDLPLRFFCPSTWQSHSPTHASQWIRSRSGKAIAYLSSFPQDLLPGVSVQSYRLPLLDASPITTFGLVLFLQVPGPESLAINHAEIISIFSLAHFCSPETYR
jgi:hypothetical protein